MLDTPDARPDIAMLVAARLWHSVGPTQRPGGKRLEIIYLNSHAHGPSADLEVSCGSRQSWERGTCPSCCAWVFHSMSVLL